MDQTPKLTCLWFGGLWRL